MTEMAERVALSEEDFRALVRGEVVKQRSPGGVEIEIILSDIGFLRMIVAVGDAATVGG